MPPFRRHHTKCTCDGVRHEHIEETWPKNMSVVLHFILQRAQFPPLSIRVPTGNFFHKHLLMKSLSDFGRYSLSNARHTFGGFRAVSER